MIDAVEGDLLIGAFGTRAATLEGVGDWERVGADGCMHTSAGLLGKLTSASTQLPRLMSLLYRGHVVRAAAVSGRTTSNDKSDLPVWIYQRLITTGSCARDIGVRRNAVRALGRIGDSRAVAALTRASRYDTDNQVREWAIRALDKIDCC